MTEFSDSISGWLFGFNWCHSIILITDILLGLFLVNVYMVRPITESGNCVFVFLEHINNDSHKQIQKEEERNYHKWYEVKGKHRTVAFNWRLIQA